VFFFAKANLCYCKKRLALWRKSQALLKASSPVIIRFKDLKAAAVAYFKVSAETGFCIK
jgi:hypothetical protein